MPLARDLIAPPKGLSTLNVPVPQKVAATSSVKMTRGSISIVYGFVAVGGSTSRNSRSVQRNSKAARLAKRRRASIVKIDPRTRVSIARPIIGIIEIQVRPKAMSYICLSVATDQTCGQSLCTSTSDAPIIDPRRNNYEEY